MKNKIPTTIPENLVKTLKLLPEVIMDHPVYYYGDIQWNGKESQLMVQGCKGTVIKLCRTSKSQLIDAPKNATRLNDLYLFRPLNGKCLFPIKKEELYIDRDDANEL